MNILFLSVTAGQGHNATAKGVMQRMEERGHTCKFIDTFDYIQPLIGSVVDKGYRNWIQLTPEGFGRAYDLLEKAEQKLPDFTDMNERFSDLLSKKFIDVYESFKPDVVVSSHPSAAQLSSAIYHRGISQAKRIGILTDFVLHPTWRGADIDRLVIPSEQMTYALVQAGIPEDIISPTGIPIREQFSRYIPKAEARAMLSIPDIPTLLVMGGSMGHGDMVATIEKLDRLPLDFQMLVVCGSNERLKAKLDGLSTVKNLKVFGFVSNVDVMMSASDLIVSKPGGLTSSEALAKGLPMVVVDPIPGLEERNLDFLTNHGLAMRANERMSLDYVVWQYLSCPERQRLMKESIMTFGKTNALNDIVALIESYDKTP